MGSQQSRKNIFLNIVLLLGTFLLAAVLRFSGINWADGSLVHPDETTVARVTLKLQSPSSLKEYFDTETSPLNPNNRDEGFYVYGTLPIMLAHWISDWLEYSNILILGRAISAAADWLVVLLVFLTGKRLFDIRVGVLAAFLYSVSALPIQQSHFFTVDAAASLFVTGAFYFAVRLIDSRVPLLDAGLFGLMLGLGTASKITAVVMAAILILAVMIRWVQHNDIEGWWRETYQVPWNTILQAVGLMVMAGLLTLITFRVFQPYAFLPPNAALPNELDPISKLLNLVGFRPNPLWFSQMQEAGFQGSGWWDAPPNHQWASRTRLLFPLKNMIAVGLGWPLGMVSWLAVVWSIWEIGRRHRGSMRLVLPSTWVLLLFFWQGARWVMTMRYFLPIYPQLTLMAAWAVITVWDRVQGLVIQRTGVNWHRVMVYPLIFGSIPVIGGLVWGSAVSTLYTRPMTRVEASHWIAENVPSDITFTLEGSYSQEYGLPNNWTPDNEQFQPLSYTRISTGSSHPVRFSRDGTLTSIRFNYIASMQPGVSELHISLTEASKPDVKLIDESLKADFYAGGSLHGEAFDLPIQSLPIEAGTIYMFNLTADADHPLILSGSILADEGDWDWPVPFPVEGYNFWGSQYHPLQLQIVGPDTTEKLDRIEYVLDQVDYLTISSNRFYHSLNRNQKRWPLTIAYYQALFSDQLGFELVADFTSRPALGPISFCDDNAEEAWTVYDHPRVFVFRKMESYDSEKVKELLRSIDLADVSYPVAIEVKDPPVRISPPGSCR